MAVHQVVCVNKSWAAGAWHEHITYLGLGNGAGWYSLVTVAEAIAHLRNPYGDRYFTISPTTGQRAAVIEGGCEVCGQRPYVRTTADGVHDNNLSALSSCQVV